MVETINCPQNALYHIVQEIEKDNIICLPEYNGIKRSENVIVLQVTLKAGRTPEQKQNMYAKISAELNAKLGIRYEDIIIVLTDSAPENWYFGRSG